MRVRGNAVGGLGSGHVRAKGGGGRGLPRRAYHLRGLRGAPSLVCHEVPQVVQVRGAEEERRA
jgi:hypothetical protein